MDETISQLFSPADPVYKGLQSLWTHVVSFNELSVKLTEARQAFEKVRSDLIHIDNALAACEGEVHYVQRQKLASDVEYVRRPVVQLEQKLTAFAELITPEHSGIEDAEDVARNVQLFAFSNAVASSLDTIIHLLHDLEKKTTDILDRVLPLLPEVAGSGMHERFASVPFKSADNVPQTPRNTVLDFAYPTSDDDREPSLEAQLKHCVLHSTGSSAPATSETGEGTIAHLEAVASVQGMGGMGKSVALIGLGNEPGVKEQFPDGRYFFELGQATREDDVRKVFTDLVGMTRSEHHARMVTGAPSLAAAAKIVAENFKDKKALFLFDDVWSSGLVDLLTTAIRFAKNSGSCIVFTTRTISIAARAARGCIRFNPRPVKSEESANILLVPSRTTEESSMSVSRSFETHKEVTDVMLRWCAGCPLTLALLGGGLSVLRWDTGSWEFAFRKLFELVSSNGTAPSPAIGPNLNRTIEIVLSLAENSEQERLAVKENTEPAPTTTDMFIRLCVFKKQATIPLSLLRRIWYELTPEQARNLARRLISLALFTDVSERGALRVRVHDHIMDFCTDEAKRRGAFPEIHSNFLDTFVAHPPRDELGGPSFLLSAIQKICFPNSRRRRLAFLAAVLNETRSWCDLPDRGDTPYLLDNLVRLLANSNRFIELVGFITNAQWARFGALEDGIRATPREISVYSGGRNWSELY